MKTKLSGYEAIEAKEQNDAVVLNKYSDPIEDIRQDITADEAREIAKEDPSLIWAEVDEIKRDEEGTAYITDADGLTRVYVIELDNGEGWALERQAVGGDENPERLSCHDSEGEAMMELATYRQ